MDLLRKALAFPMYGAAAWLAWVLTVQAGDGALVRVFAAGLVLAFGAWLYGLAQRRGSPILTGVGLACAILAVAVAVWPGYGSPRTQASGETAAVPYQAWSPERLAAARAAGRPVLVNFTAAWCVTCKLNERTSLTAPGVAEAFRRTGAIYLKADWTRKDAVIEAELARHGRAGVPLYLVYGAKGGEAVILPQILTEGLVVRALEDARRR